MLNNEGNISIYKLNFRFKFLIYLLLVPTLIGFLQIINLSIVGKEDYSLVTEKNRVERKSIFTPRGLIKLSDNSIVAENLVNHRVILRDKIDQIILKELELFSKVLGIDVDIDNLKKQSPNINHSNYFTITENLSELQLAKFYAQNNKWPTLEIKANLKRYLPDEGLFSHAVGHLGPINSLELQQYENSSYNKRSLVGKVGIEKYYEKELRGGVGSKTLEVDVYGKVVRELERVNPIKAQDIYLSLNRNLQKSAKEMLKDYRGAIIALDPKTGLIKALVSSPDYNPNFYNKSDASALEGFAPNQAAPLFNRVISGTYPPASTIKPFLGLLGLESKIVSGKDTVNDIGFFQLDGEGRKYRGWREEGHGEVNLSQAIRESSDVYFYDLATKIKIESIESFLRKFGFGSLTEIDLANERTGILPSRSWKLGTIGENWVVGDTVNMGIGQGYLSVTPIQLAVSVSMIANRGIAYKPTIVQKIDDIPSKHKILYEISLDNQVWDEIEESMESVISHWKGTAHNIYKVEGFRLAGKTGTAQIKSLAGEDLSVKEEYEVVREIETNRDHALFVSYGPLPNPNLVIVVVVENGESGSAVAAPMASSLFNLYQEEISDY